jgi:pimeloyl-ACP methyl ester carboxylesterase
MSLRTIFLLVILVSAPLRAFAQGFNFAVDSLQVDGNIPGGYFDDFNNPVPAPTTSPTPQISCLSNVSVSGGFLILTSADGANNFTPGFLTDNCILGQNAPAFRLNRGSGNSVITASFRADVPTAGQNYGLQLFTFGTNELVNIQAGSSGTGAIVTATAQSASLSRVNQSVGVNLTGVSRILLRLAYDDVSKRVTYSFSTDGGTTFTEITLPQPGTVMTTGNQAVVSVFGSVQVPKPVVIIPGIMGTYLFDERAAINGLIWINAVEALLSFSDDFLRQLALGSEGLSLLSIQASPIFDGSIAAGGGPLTNKYGTLIDFLKQAGYQENVLLFTFPYDWRLDNRLTAFNLNDFIENVVIPKSGQSQVDIIVHSMGGLVLRDYALRFGQHRLGKVVYIATPHVGAPASFGPLAFNDSLVSHFLNIPFVNSQTLAEVSRTFPSLFQLLPREPFIFSSSLQRSLSLDESYLQPPNGFGFLVSSAWVGSADALHQTIGGQLSVPQFEVVGGGVPTLTQLMLEGDPSTGPRVWCAQGGDGDGTVPILSATSVPGSATAFYLDLIKHEDLPNNQTAQQLLVQILQNNLDTLPSGVKTQHYPNVGFIEWCSGSPIKVTITDPGSRVDGVALDASVRNEIPLSSFFVFETNESGLLPPGQEYGVKIVATGTGVFSLTFNQKDANGVITNTTKFSDVPVAAGSIGTFLLSPGLPGATLGLDIDGDGSVDIMLPANEPITPEASNTILGLVIRSFRLAQGIQESLLAKINAAEKAINAGRPADAVMIYRALLNEVSAQTGINISATQAQGLTVIIDHLVRELGT